MPGRRWAGVDLPAFYSELGVERKGIYAWEEGTRGAGMDLPAFYIQTGGGKHGDVCCGRKKEGTHEACMNLPASYSEPRLESTGMCVEQENRRSGR